jgi:hypothetical protein
MMNCAPLVVYDNLFDPWTQQFSPNAFLAVAQYTNINVSMSQLQEVVQQVNDLLQNSLQLNKRKTRMFGWVIINVVLIVLFSVAFYLSSFAVKTGLLFVFFVVFAAVNVCFVFKSNAEHRTGMETVHFELQKLRDIWASSGILVDFQASRELVGYNQGVMRHEMIASNNGMIGSNHHHHHHRGFRTTYRLIISVVQTNSEENSTLLTNHPPSYNSING